MAVHITEAAFVFVEGVLTAEGAALILQLRMTYPAPIFISFVFLTPQPTLVAFLGITDKAGFSCCFVSMHQCGHRAACDFDALLLIRQLVARIATACQYTDDCKKSWVRT
jgi:hypothetical protein